MTELGIILDFKNQMITIDEINLPMQSINDLPSSNRDKPIGASLLQQFLIGGWKEVRWAGGDG
jgi:hypothetical protein